MYFRVWWKPGQVSQKFVHVHDEKAMSDLRRSFILEIDSPLLESLKQGVTFTELTCVSIVFLFKIELLFLSIKSLIFLDNVL